MPRGGPGIPRPGAGVSQKRGTMTKAYKHNTFKASNIDRRRREVRDAWALLQNVYADQGGESELAATTRTLAERFAFNVMRVRRMEADALSGKSIDERAYFNAATLVMRLADRLGYTRRQKRITLADVIREHALEAQNTPPAGPPAARQVHTDAATPDGAGHQSE